MPCRLELAFIFAVPFLLVTGTACAAVAPDPVQALEQDFTIAVGKSVRIGGTDLEVRFESVQNDSRCPSDVQCVTAGDATVLVTAAAGSAVARRYELHTEEGTREAAHGEYRLILVDLKPVPISTRPVRASEYVLTLRIIRP